MTFAADLAKYADKIGRSLTDTQRAVVIELFSSTISDTPVDQGWLRGNWLLSEGQPNLSTRKVADPNNTIVQAELQGFAATLLLGSNCYMANSTPYAYRIEYEGWSHTKAPEGMMRRNMARVQGIVARAVRSNR